MQFHFDCTLRKKGSVSDPLGVQKQSVNISSFLNGSTSQDPLGVPILKSLEKVPDSIPVNVLNTVTYNKGSRTWNPL